MWQSLHDAWWRLATAHPRTFSETLLSGVLTSGASCYRLGTHLRNRAYEQGWIRPVRLPCPVVSVGNLTIGGTGKTACVELLATKLLQLGRRVAILSRGYGGRLPRPYWLLTKDGRVLLNGHATPAVSEVADEPYMLAQHLAQIPVLVGPRRDQTGRQACEQFQAQAILLDDGFQHRRLARDLDVVLVSARMPLGGWPLVPRGPMREPLAALARASVIIVTKIEESLDRLAALQEHLRTFNPEALMASAVHEPAFLIDGRTAERLPVDHLVNRRLFLLSSIGDPEGFEQTVRSLGATVTCHVAYPDHHRYDPDEWRSILSRASSSGAEVLVTTEKDAIRLGHPNLPHATGHLPVWILRVHLRLMSGETELDDRLARVCIR